MAPGMVWSAERHETLVLDSGGLRLLVGFCVLAANFALLLLPPSLAALVLLGVIR